MDVSEYVRFKRPGHRVTGDRRSQDHHLDGTDHVHAVVDDHSRLAYAEIHSDARAETAAAFLERALAFYAAHGIRARRLMTDAHTESGRVLCHTGLTTTTSADRTARSEAGVPSAAFTTVCG